MKAVKVAALCAIILFAGVFNAHAYPVTFAIDDSWQAEGINLVGFDLRAMGDDINQGSSAFNVPADWDTSIIGGIFSITGGYLALSLGNTPLSAGHGVVWEVNSGNVTLGDWNFSDNLAGSHNASNAYVSFDATTNTYTFSCHDPEVPIPPSVLLLASGMLGLVGLRRKMRGKQQYSLGSWF